MTNLQDDEVTPLVSVIMNCYNGAMYLDDAIKSVINQSYKNWELVFWDNKSTDNSLELVNKYTDPRIKIYQSKETVLLYSARNKAFKKCLGSLITFLDVDDWWSNNKLALQVQVMRTQPATVLVYSNYIIYFSDSSKTKIALGDKYKKVSCTSDLLKKYEVGLLTVMFRAGILSNKSDAPFDDRYNMLGDFDLVVRLSCIGSFSYIEKPLGFYRLHGQNLSKNRYGQWADEFAIWVRENERRFGRLAEFKMVMNNIVWHRALESKIQNRNCDLIFSICENVTCVTKFKLVVLLILPMSVLKKVKSFV